LEEVLDCVFGVLAGFRRDGPSSEEVDRARQRHRFDLEFGRDSLGAWAERHVWPLLYSSVREDVDEMNALQKIGTEELRALARRLLAPERLHVAMVGPLDSANEAMVERVVQKFTAGKF
jgi:predicted Zn-dependent peptidase